MHLTSQSNDNEGHCGVEDEEEEEEDDEDGGGWITPSNIKQIQMNAGECPPSESVTVGCLTTDFAMQVSGVSEIMSCCVEKKGMMCISLC